MTSLIENAKQYIKYEKENAPKDLSGSYIHGLIKELDEHDDLLDKLWLMRDVNEIRNKIRAFSKPKSEIKDV